MKPLLNKLKKITTLVNFRSLQGLKEGQQHVRVIFVEFLKLQENNILKLLKTNRKIMKITLC